MRFTAVVAGVFLFALILATDKPQAQAEANINSNIQLSSTKIDNVLEEVVDEAKRGDQPAPVTASAEYTVVNGDTLAKIATEHNQTWKRLFDKNQQITDPNIITPGQKILIPSKDEVLPERAVPASAPVQSQPVRAPRSSATVQGAQAPTQYSRGDSSGNRYYYGYCTWYAKQRRPDLPNNLGDAISWVARARAQGIATGSTPRVGAVGQQGNHVVFVEAVNANGTVTISEMNYVGRGVVNSRTVPAGTFQYIY